MFRSTLASSGEQAQIRAIGTDRAPSARRPLRRPDPAARRQPLADPDGYGRRSGSAVRVELTIDACRAILLRGPADAIP
jgi:hypothetical protein